MKITWFFNTTFELLARTSITYNSTYISMSRSYRTIDKKNPIMRKNKEVNIMKFKKEQAIKKDVAVIMKDKG